MGNSLPPGGPASSVTPPKRHMSLPMFISSKKKSHRESRPQSEPIYVSNNYRKNSFQRVYSIREIQKPKRNRNRRSSAHEISLRLHASARAAAAEEKALATIEESAISSNNLNNTNGDQRQRRTVVCSEPINTNEPYTIPYTPKSKSEIKLISQILKGNFFLTALSPTEYRQLVGAFSAHDVPAGDNIITEGNIGDYFYILRDGEVSFSVNGVPIGPSTATPCCFGELALLYDARRTATCHAERHCSLWRVDQHSFRYIVTKSKKNHRAFVRESLQKVSYFASVDERTLATMMDVMVTLKFAAGERIVTKGYAADAFYVVQEGRVKVHDKGGGKSTYVDQVLGVGDNFGEDALLSSSSIHHANITAVEDCTLLCASRMDFESTMGPLEELLAVEGKKNFLKSVPIFAESHFTNEILKELAEHFEEESYDEGHVLIKKGDPLGSIQSINFIKDGSAAMVSHNGTLINFKKGDHFGQESIKSSPNAISEYTITVSSKRLTLQTLKRSNIETVIHTIDRLGNAKHQSTTLINRLNSTIKLSDIIKIDTIGSGGFGDVWKVRHARDRSQLYALKQISKSKINSKYLIESAIRERNITASLNHPFIINLVSTFRDDDNLYMLMEYLDGGSLFKSIRDAHGHCREGLMVHGHIVSVARFHAATVLEALHYMHGMSICYRDLKPENILLDSNGYCVLVDLGFAKDVVDKTYTFCGTTEYMAPEIVLSSGHNKGVDYWAFGCLIYEMIMNQSPFYNRNVTQTQLMKSITHDKTIYPRDCFSEELEDLIEGLVKKKPVCRLGCTKGGTKPIYQHKWFKEINFDDLVQKKLTAPQMLDLRHSDDGK